MGNKAIIATRESIEHNGTCVYVHWSGDLDSITAFLRYCKLKGYRSPTEDSSYGWAMLVTVISNTFASGLSCGVDTYENLYSDLLDNGVYVIEDWDIVERINKPEDEKLDEKLVKNNIEVINESQPYSMRL